MVNRVNVIRTGIMVLSVVWMGCTYYENEVFKIPKPDVPTPTTILEATYLTTPPNKLTSPYWKTADYLAIDPQNNVTGQVPTEDGLFNVSGAFRGLLDFNKGKDPKITLKAAYDDTKIYILISWKDTTFNASNASWIFNGPPDPNKSGVTTGWTSQRSDDKFILSFNMGSSTRDVWNWSLALSEPLGYAMDMVEVGGTTTTDAGNKTYSRNSSDLSNRSGPKYEWDGVQQEIQRDPAGQTILDPGYYLLTKKSFVGDALAGSEIFLKNCAICHGVEADGNGTEYVTDKALNMPGFFNRYTRSSFDALVSNSNHEGSAHFTPLSDKEREDLFARLRGFSGIPGYYLESPSGSNSDIHAVSNVQLAKIDGNNSKGYSVLLIRALNTGNADDIVFNPSTQLLYDFTINLMDNDDINRIGSINKQLTFNPKQ